MIDAVRKAADRVGGVPSLAARLGVSRQALYQWRRIPAEKVAIMARETGLDERALRPDLFGSSSPGADPIRYHDDVAAWAMQQAAFLRAGETEHLDIDNLCEEIEDLSRSDRRQIESRLTVLLKHLLKMHFQPDQHTPSWDATLLEQRARIGKILRESPSLKTYPGEVLAEEYALARREASIETGISLDVLPETCPFAIDDVLDLDFVPGRAIR